MTTPYEYWRINATLVSEYHVEEISSPHNATQGRQAQKTTWQVERELGRGTFGRVRLERHVSSGRTRAVKKIVLDHYDYEKELLALVEFSKARYRNAAVFVEFLGWFHQGPNMYFAMEYLALGDLETILSSRPDRIPANEVKAITRQILVGLEIMHGEKFTHRDLKPKNVLVVEMSPWHVKLADFGSSKRLTESMVFNTKCGTPLYQAPEQRFDYLEDDSEENKMTSAVDIWATGCIAYNLMTGGLPFPLESSTLKSYCKGATGFPRHHTLSSEATAFIRLLLSPRYQDRPPAPEALRHKWLASYEHRNISEIQGLTSKIPHTSPSTNENLSSEINYNTASHMGLKSPVLRAKSSSRSTLRFRHKTVGNLNQVYRDSLGGDEKEVAKPLLVGRPLPPIPIAFPLNPVSEGEERVNYLRRTTDRNENFSARTLVQNLGIQDNGVGKKDVVEQQNYKQDDEGNIKHDRSRIARREGRHEPTGQKNISGKISQIERKIRPPKMEKLNEEEEDPDQSEQTRSQGNNSHRNDNHPQRSPSKANLADKFTTDIGVQELDDLWWNPRIITRKGHKSNRELLRGTRYGQDNIYQEEGHLPGKSFVQNQAVLDTRREHTNDITLNSASNISPPGNAVQISISKLRNSESTRKLRYASHLETNHMGQTSKPKLRSRESRGKLPIASHLRDEVFDFPFNTALPNRTFGQGPSSQSPATTIKSPVINRAHEPQLRPSSTAKLPGSRSSKKNGDVFVEMVFNYKNWPKKTVITDYYLEHLIDRAGNTPSVQAVVHPDKNSISGQKMHIFFDGQLSTTGMSDAEFQEMTRTYGPEDKVRTFMRKKDARDEESAPMSIARASTPLTRRALEWHDIHMNARSREKG